MKTRPRRKRSQSAPVRRQFSTRLHFESLEPRAMLAADPGWAFGLGGPAILSESAVNIGPDNHVYVTGSFAGTVDLDPGPGTAQFTTHLNAQDGFIAKYTQQGEFVWANTFGGNLGPGTGPVGHELSRGIEFDAGGNVYLAGISGSSSPRFGSITLANQNPYDVFVTKIDALTGNFLWARRVGGTGNDLGYDLEVNSAGDVYVAGQFDGTVDFDPSAGSTYNLTSSGENDAFVWKLDTGGNFVWVRQFGGIGSDITHRVSLGNDGYVYAVGTFRDTVDFGQPGTPLILTNPTGVGTSNSFIVKLDEATGDSVWARQIGGLDRTNAARIVADGAGGLFVAGGFEGTLDFGGSFAPLVSAGLLDTYITKWDTDGALVWAEKIGGTGDDIPREFTVDSNGNPLTGISFEGTVDFDPGANAANLTSAGQTDAAVVKLNTNGNLQSVRQISGPGTTEAYGLVEDAAGNTFVTGFYQSSVSLPTGHSLTNSGNGTFFMKLAFGDPSTKFYVVDDASANRTFEYQSSGASGGNSALNSGNTAPRGAASTAAGDRVWVVDANRKVFVYDINGNVLGSWTAGTMASNATPEGIATNGTDVWIVDSKSDKVFKYTGEASRLSGSQNAASSFNLNSSNADAKDIVTDGSSLWVVNDSSTDKVFKYTVAGSLLGSWTIAAANSKPTGLTIDPSNVSNIWIVDSGTDRVYQYTGAASRTSGNQTAATTFALAAGNTNPQGIADPPPAGTREPVRSRDSNSLAPRFAIASAAKAFETAISGRSVERTPARRLATPAAREHVFESLASGENDNTRTKKPHWCYTDGQSIASELLSQTDDSFAALDDAFEFVLQSAI